MIWASLGAKTIELVHQNLTVGEADEDVEILAMDADLIDEFLEKQKDLKLSLIHISKKCRFISM